MSSITPSKYVSIRATTWLWVLLTVLGLLLCFGLYWRVTRTLFKHDRTVLERIGKDIGTRTLTQSVNGTM